MSVRIGDDAEQELRLEKPRHPYLLGSHAAADSRAGESCPPAASSYAATAIKSWVTLLDSDVEARVEDRPLSLDERRLWPKGALLRVGDVQLSWADPTARVLEQVERDPTERLKDGEEVDPPTGKKGKARAKTTALVSKLPSAGDLPPEPELAPEPKKAPGLAPAWLPLAGRWTLLDAVVCAIALSVIGISLWAIRWIAELGRA